MPKLDIYNVSGETVGSMELSANVFDIDPSIPAMHQVVRNILANRRQGTQSTKTRSEVRGGGRKPYRQKGTGHARQGTITAPHYVGGGVAFGPKPRSYGFSIPKKVKKLALKSALSAKQRDSEIIILDELKLGSPKTKDMIKILGNVKIENQKVLILTEAADRNVYKSSSNIQGVKTTFAGEINVYDILNHDILLATKSAIEKLEEVYS